MNVAMLGRRYVFAAFLLYLAFVVYGSLIPFDYRDRSIEEAIQAFAEIGYLNLGVVSRADWVANIVLYVPLAFLGCAWVIVKPERGRLPYLAVLSVLAICLAVAVAIEFAQIFFAPRTVSLNDLLAETLGTIGGIVLWAFGRERRARLLEAFAQADRQSVFAAIGLYGLLYVALSLFPYDFIISMSELHWKLSSGNQAWLVAGGCSDGLRCAVRLVAEAAAIAPLGLLIALVVPNPDYRRVFAAGVVLGLGLEALQFLIASGTTQGLSVLLRGAGLVAGLSIGQVLQRQGLLSVARLVWQGALVAVLPYILVLAAVSGWFSSSWLPLEEVFDRVAEVRLMPFYYHYYSSEPAAMASLLAQAAMYAPIGLVYWAWLAVRPSSAGRGALGSALGAAMLALLIELGKLFVPAKHPDLTNILIGAGGAAFAFACINWLQLTLGFGQPRTVPAEMSASPAPMPTISGRMAPHPIAALLVIAVGLALVIGLMRYPVGAPWLGLLLLGYAMLLWRRPLLWLFVVPALLPVLDLSPLTGRLLFDEFDLLVLVTLAVGYWRIYARKPMPWPHSLLPVAITLLWTTWAICTARGLWPLLGMEDGIADSSHSPFEAWFVGKGLLWALLLVPLMRRVPQQQSALALRYLLHGVMAGLVVVMLAVLWERHVYVGLGDFENVFRVTGTFSNMHTGGAYIEAFIAFAFPVIVVWMLMARKWSLKLAGFAVAMLTVYAMLVTFSRGGYAGLVAGVGVVALGSLRVRAGAPRRQGLLLAGLVTAVVAVAIPVLSGGFAQDRLGRVAEDLAVRKAHWARALGLMDDGPLAALTGMGFGQYPIHYLLQGGGDKPPATYRVMLEGDNAYLRIGAGETAYLDQLVAVEPDTRYSLSARVRMPTGEGALSIGLCEKALLYSFGCVWQRFEPEPNAKGWRKQAVQFDNEVVGTGNNWLHRPVKVSLFNSGPTGSVELDDISLAAIDGTGRNLLANGDFSAGVARWLFATDQDLAWHIHQQELEMYFAQGVLGLLALVVLLVAVAGRLGPAVLAGNMPATALAGALVAFLTVGLLGSTMDTSRLSMLFYLGAIGAGVLASRHAISEP